MKAYSMEFKLEAVRRMKTCKTISGLAEELAGCSIPNYAVNVLTAFAKSQSS
jgi:hypothetical protein